jgi:hypothetical protein
MTFAQQLVARWRQHGVPLNPSASPADLNDLRPLLGCELPQDIREFYSLANGMPDLTYDEHEVSFWSISKIRTEVHNWGDTRLGFADFLIDSWRFIFEVNDGGVVDLSENVPVGRPMQNLGTLDQFLETYLTDPSWLSVM